jgi:outer membrane receptor protein involved in Fe transport
MQKNLTFLCLFFILNNGLLNPCFAQTQIGGMVSDKKTKEPLIGASLMTNIKNGTTTDIDGKYNLALAENERIIAFSSLGYDAFYLNLDSLQKVEGKIPNPLHIFLEATAQELDITVVSGSRYERKMTEETVAIEVIKPSFLERQSTTSLNEAVERIPGVQVLDGQVNIRNGSGYAYGAGSRVLIMVDDMPLLSADIGDVKWNFMPIENAEQIEVIKGAASVQYGASALNGVIHLRTAMPTNTPYTNVTMYAGVYDAPSLAANKWWSDSWNERPFQAGIFISHRQKVTKNLDLVLGANVHQTQGYIKTLNEERERFNFNLRYHLKDKRWTAGINGNMMRHAEGHFFLWQNTPKGVKDSTIYVPAGGSIGLDRYNTYTFDPYLQYLDTAGTRHLVRGRYYHVQFLRGGGTKDMPVSTSSAEYQFQKQFKKQHLAVSLGANYQYFSVFSTLFTASDTIDYVNGYKTGSSLAFFAQADKKFLHQKLNLTAGMRAERYSVDGNSTAIIPVFRAGANYRLTKNDFLRGSWGQGYRFPSFAERFIDENVTGTIIKVLPNPKLSAESGWSSELAIKHTFVKKSWKGYADASLFLMDYKDMVEFNFDFHLPEDRSRDSVTFDDVKNYLGFKSKNLSMARIGGFELSTMGEGKIFQHQTRLWTGYTYSFPADLTSNPAQRDLFVFTQNAANVFVGIMDSTLQNSILRYRNLHTLRFDCESDFDKLTLGGAVNYNSPIVRLDDIFTGSGNWGELVEAVNNGPILKGLKEMRERDRNGYWIFDLRAAYAFTPKHKLLLSVQNVLNTEYALRPGKMNATRLFNIRYNHTF